ncbi:PTS sugar transporter subunit IIA [Companilactobacillus kimchiensis]|uniref:PTS EIIA type-1 domain-containing protein n=1 Tax=Companilactobacillus kimchiensis TaxID=993692 RepID=A0A0R2LG99_9LACO|nr:PTS glucose transporter subunit IIA [Companilactobacillus kimchiensis]KRN99030.1 hypothetical protein IV57_GL000600 [Companilactobacillus kimchiensis]
MGLFSKKTELYAPVSGVIKSVFETSDELFSSRSMGDGFMIEPNSKNIYSPIKGKIVSVFPTKHAIAIKTNNLEFLLHIGIDTVELNGEGFEINISENDKVDQNTLLGTVDFDFIKKMGKKTDVIFICTNLNETQKITLFDGDKINHSDNVGFIK